MTSLYLGKALHIWHTKSLYLGTALHMWHTISLYLGTALHILHLTSFYFMCNIVFINISARPRIEFAAPICLATTE